MKVLFILIAFIATFAASSLSGRPSSCAELLLDGTINSGIYTIFPRPWFSLIPFQVYCDMETDGGGWTLFQRRGDYETQENFTRNWNEYKTGFGSLDMDFWLGNDRLFILTNQDQVTLRIDMEDFEEVSKMAQYKTFQISNCSDDYRITVRDYEGTANDSLLDTNKDMNPPFSTYDKNDDAHGCAKLYKGGYWYVSCHRANPNGLYLKGNHTSYADGINWYYWHGYHYSLKKIEMKVRPKNFVQQCQCNSMRK